MPKSRLEEIEELMSKYPDVPVEVMFKEDILRLGFDYTDAALEAAKDALKKTYRIFATDEVEFGKMKKEEHLRAPAGINITGGSYHLRPTKMETRIALASPYKVDVINGKLVICADGKPFADVEYPSNVKYISKTFSTGEKWSDIAAIGTWKHTIHFTVHKVCQRWDDNGQCLYCDINAFVNERKKAGKYSLSSVVLDLEKVAEVVKSTLLGEDKEEGENRFLNIGISGGTITKELNGLNDTEFYLQYVKAIRKAVGNRLPLSLTIVAKSEKDLKRLHDAGVNVIRNNIEVWDKRLFDIMCPGKNRTVGRDEWIRRVIKAVDFFGEGNVQPYFVTGVEMAQPYGFKDVDSAVKSTSEGLDYLMSRGVTPRFMTWCIEPGSALANHPPIPLEYYVAIDRSWYRTWKKYLLPYCTTNGPMGPGQAIFHNSAFYDVGA